MTSSSPPSTSGSYVLKPDTASELRACSPANAELISVELSSQMLGIVYHVRYMRELRVERRDMIRAGLIHGQSSYPASLTLITACALLLLGVLAIGSMAFELETYAPR